MPDLLGATNPVPNYDSAAHNRPLPAGPQAPDPRVQNVADPTRVSRADGKTERQGADNNLGPNGLRYDSNLQTFLQQLRDAPDLAAVLTKTLVWMRGMASTPGLSAGIAQEISNLLQMLQMDAPAFEQFFLQQVQAGNRFSGPIFSLLRQVYRSSPDPQLHEAILSFVKRYSDFSSTGHIGRTMTALLRQMPDYMPRSWRGRLEELTAQLERGLQAGDRGGNLQLLQGEILPYLGSYVERSHDLGTIRTFISLLMLNMARYENGDEAGLLAAFRQLSGYGDTLAGLNQLDDASILRLLQENDFGKAAQSDQFAQKLTDTASQALQGKFGAEAREGFEEIVRSMLLNESVFMPLNHMILPLEWNGKMMYSEVWVDPDAEDQEQSGKKQQGGGKVQFLFKLDVQSLGFLEMTLASREDQVELDVYGPEAVERSGSIIAQDLRDILAGHGLTGKKVTVSRRERPLTLTEVFPDLFEGKRSVNVKV